MNYPGFPDSSCGFSVCMEFVTVVDFWKLQIGVKTVALRSIWVCGKEGKVLPGSPFRLKVISCQRVGQIGNQSGPRMIPPEWATS
jgi:hypothetical protein